MARRDVVVIGASAGGLEPLTALVSRLPADLPACVLVVMHSATNGSGVLPEILGRSTTLPVAFAEDGDPIEPGRIYVARPDFHLTVTDGAVSVVHGPRENGFRPAIDPLFRTAAREFGPRVIGVVLSGALADGTYGLSVIKRYGGIAVAQDPEDAVIPSMPLNAIKYAGVDRIVPAHDLGATIASLTSGNDERQGGTKMPRRKNEIEPQAPHATEVSEMEELYGPPSGLTCPDCGGALWEIRQGRVVRYQCHVGHQYAPENLEQGQRDEIDSALWSAVRVLEEHAELKTRMAARATAGGLRAVSAGFTKGARDAHEQAQRLLAVLFDAVNGGGMGAPATAHDADAVRAAGVRGRKSRPRAQTHVPQRRRRR
jgi:two-component system chemotaxis response regulator CheB